MTVDADVAAYFDEHDAKYDQQSKHGSAAKIAYLQRNGQPTDLFVDVGCGNGWFQNAVVERTPIANVVGVDVSRGMMDRTNAGEFALGSGTDLPLQDGTADFVHVDAVLHHLVGATRRESFERAQRAIEHALRVLTDDGCLILTEHCFHGRLVRAWAPWAIFYLLKYGTKPGQYLHPEIEDGLRASFFTDEQVATLVERAGGTVVEREEYVVESKLVEKPFLNERRRINFYVEPDRTDAADAPL